MMNNEIKTNQINGWDSELNIFNRMKVVIPFKLLLGCNQIASMVKGNEFSIVTDIKEKSNSKLTLSDEFYIPKQNVSSTNIEYTPDSYNQKVVIHRHPDRLDNFSRTDMEFINQNFELSLLYTKEDGFVNGIYNYRLDEENILQMPVEIVLNYETDPIDISNITIDLDFFHRDILNKDSKLDGVMTEKLNEKSLTSKKTDPIEELENRVFVLEEAVFYNSPLESGHF